MYTKWIQTVNKMQIEFNNQGYIQGSKPEYKKKIRKWNNYLPLVKEPTLKLRTKKSNKLWKGFKNYVEEHVDQKYFLSEKATLGILRHKENSKARGNGFGATIHELLPQP